MKRPRLSLRSSLIVPHLRPALLARRLVSPYAGRSLGLLRDYEGTELIARDQIQ